ncbi:MAG: hypothetical protein GY847_32625 [Proteobacteria bacterium]|nr:hypothetical protein [Pseudomonadota bacterium]
MLWGTSYRLYMPEEKWRQIEFSFDGSDEKKVSSITDIDAHCRRIAGHLTVRLPEPVDVVFTNNRSTMVSFKRGGGRLMVRLHRMFRHADHDVLDSLALYLGKRDSASSKILDRFIANYKEEISSTGINKRVSVRPEGRHHDLSLVLKRVNQTYFDGKVDVKIGWGREPVRRRRRRGRTVSRALAMYSFDDRTIKVSPILDSKDVPDYVLDWIVYHEMLHHVLPVEKSGGKRQYHTQKFKVLERAFIRYEDAKSWEKIHLHRLLS